MQRKIILVLLLVFDLQVLSSQAVMLQGHRGQSVSFNITGAAVGDGVTTLDSTPDSVGSILAGLNFWDRCALVPITVHGNTPPPDVGGNHRIAPRVNYSTPTR